MLIFRWIINACGDIVLPTDWIMTWQIHQVM
jgi:hypothetical protein